MCCWFEKKKKKENGKENKSKPNLLLIMKEIPISLFDIKPMSIERPRSPITLFLSFVQFSHENFVICLCLCWRASSAVTRASNSTSSACISATCA